MESTVAGRARIMWCMRLHSALRAAVACAIVGGATIYGPEFVVKEVKFAAFSYLTAVLIVCDATLGDTLKGCWHAFCATAQVVPIAMLARWWFDPKAGLPISLAALVVVVAAFLVALPESTHLTAKRIAFGQIVLVCTDAVVGSDSSGPGFMHPLHVAASTGLGALASVLALLLPFPGLAHQKVEKLCGVYAENAWERMNLYFRAFNAKENHTRTELISQAKPVAETGTKLLQSITTLEEGIHWERPFGLFSRSELVHPGDRMQAMELPMRGIEYSLVSSPPLPLHILDQEQFSNIIQRASSKLRTKIEKTRSSPPSVSTIEPETGTEFKEQEPLPPLEQIFPINKYEWVFFFFSCIDMLLNHAHTTSREPQTRPKKPDFSIIRTFKNAILSLTRNGRLEFAFKCSLSLGSAVLFGLIFDKENGCWAGLTIAISFVTGRQAVFTVANTRAQGTAIGSVYGVICCFLFHYEELRLLALLPWIVFTCFLRHSRMYSQTGGVSAAIGALLILGRKKYGSPNEFALARLTEVFIGVSCFILVEFFLQPARAATLARNHTYLTLCSIRDCLNQMGTEKKLLEWKENQRNLDSLVCELRKLVTDADSEPDFWYLPFRTCCYQKLVGYISNIVDMLYFITYNLEILTEIPGSGCSVRNEFQEQMNSELDLFKENLSSLLRYMEKKKPGADFQETMDEKLRDLEAGKLQNLERINGSTTEDDEAQNNSNEDSKNRERTVQDEEAQNYSNEDSKNRERTVRRVAAVRFCISSLRKEIDRMEICMKEIAQWEGHSSL